jgi:hypothetical protein
MSPESMSLANLIGQEIHARIPSYQTDKPFLELRLLGVEAGGIWVESHDFMEEIFATTSYTMSPKTIVLFLPYAQILAIYVPRDSPWISRKAAQ